MWLLRKLVHQFVGAEWMIFKYCIVSGQKGEYVHLPVKKIIPRHVEDYVFIWDYRW